MEKQQVQQICKRVMLDEDFLKQVRKQIFEQQYSQVQSIIQQLTLIIEELITRKLQQQMLELIQDNNRILSQIKHNVILMQNKPQIIEFNDIHKLITQEKNRVFNHYNDCNDADLEKSISAMVEIKYQNIEERVKLIQKKIRCMEDKYQTNFKSLWNVMSMTQAALFDHLKNISPNKIQFAEHCKADKQQTKNKKQSFFNLKLWK